MSRENRYTALILKKQAYGESDELITMYSLEAGKLRALARSVKMPKSKLSYSLQSLFVCNVTLAGSHLPKIISASAVFTFSRLRENLPALAQAFYGLEVLMKYTPDEQKNEGLYYDMVNFLTFLEENNSAEARVWALAKYKIDFLKSVGLEVVGLGSVEALLAFSNSMGGFVKDAPDKRPVFLKTFNQAKLLNAAAWENLPTLYGQGLPEELNEVLAGFLEYHLEREIKSERFRRENSR